MRTLSIEGTIAAFVARGSANSGEDLLVSAVADFLSANSEAAEEKLVELAAVRLREPASALEYCEVQRLRVNNFLASGELNRADAAASNLCSYAESRGDNRLNGIALSSLAAVTAQKGNLPYALDLAVRAKASLAEDGSRGEFAQALITLAYILIAQGDVRRASRELDAASVLAESVGAQFLVARAAHLSATLLQRLGRFAEARERLVESELAYSDSGASERARLIKFGLAALDCYLGCSARAISAFRDIEQDLGREISGLFEARWRLVAAWSKVRLGDATGGRSELVALVSTFERLSSQRDLGLCHEFLGDAHVGLKDLAKAEEHYEEGLKLGRMVSPTSDVTLECLWKSGELFLATGRYLEALQRARQALWVARVSSNRFERAAVCRLRGKIQAARGRTKLAESLLSHAWSEYVAMGADVDAGKTKELLDKLRGGALETPSPPERTGSTAGPRVAVRSPKAVRALEAEMREAGIVSVDPRVLEAYQMAVKAADTKLPVMIFGETGTGKELFASLIHLRSNSSRSFVPVNCAALPPDLLDAELFGHARGAFTGALRDRPGLIEEANGGTLFLDEVGEMTLPVQGRLLRAVEQGEIRRIGETKPRYVTTRYVAATHRDLLDMVRVQTFRTDLYFRLQGVVIAIPPLRDRVADIDLLIDHFLTTYGLRLRRSVRLTGDARERLRTHAWPGNVRELRSLIDRLVSLNEDGAELGEADLGLTRPKMSASLAEHLEEEERKRLMAILESVRWNQSATSRILRIKRTTLLGKMKRLGIVSPKKK